MATCFDSIALLAIGTWWMACQRTEYSPKARSLYTARNFCYVVSDYQDCTERSVGGLTIPSSTSRGQLPAVPPEAAPVGKLGLQWKGKRDPRPRY